MLTESKSSHPVLRIAACLCAAVQLAPGGCDPAAPPAASSPAFDTPSVVSDAPESRTVDELLAAGEFREVDRRLEAAGPYDDPRREARRLYRLARAREGAGRGGEALAAVDAALRLSPANPEAHRLRGTILLSLERPADAVDSLRRAVALAETFQEKTGRPVPGLHRWRYQLARALVDAGKPEQAEEELAIYRAAQQTEIRLRRLERLASYAGASPQSWLDYGAALLEAGRRVEARAALERARELQPQDEDILQRLRDLEEAAR